MRIVYIKENKPIVQDECFVLTALTHNKIYDVIRMERSTVSSIEYYVIIDDHGNSWGYPIELFASLDEIRDEKLNQLGI